MSSQTKLLLSDFVLQHTNRWKHGALPHFGVGGIWYVSFHRFPHKIHGLSPLNSTTYLRLKNEKLSVKKIDVSFSYGVSLLLGGSPINVNVRFHFTMMCIPKAQSKHINSSNHNGINTKIFIRGRCPFTTIAPCQYVSECQHLHPLASSKVIWTTCRHASSSTRSGAPIDWEKWLARARNMPW